MTDGDLFDRMTQPDPRSTDPATSLMAAMRDPAARSNDRRRALAAHYNNPQGLTDFELAAIVDRQQTSAGKRRGELRDAALIVSTDETRPAPSGSPAIVWKINDAGRRFWEELNRLPAYAHGKTSSETAG